MRVYGHSMSPMLNPGEVLFIRDEAFAHRDPRRGELVAARPMACGGKAFVKRIVGMPGERVWVGERSWTLGDQEYFILGDQPNHSVDSRIFGPVTREELIGSVQFRVWPLKKPLRDQREEERSQSGKQFRVEKLV